MAGDPTDAWKLLDGKVSVPSELRTAEWDMVPQWIRERAFYMAGVADAEILEEFRKEVGEIAAGRRSIEESRKRLGQFLDAKGYQPEPGQEGTIKDLRSARRQLITLRTNVELLQGWGQKERGMRPGPLRAFPGWELVRVDGRMVPRDWESRFRRVGGELVDGGRMIALKQDLIWADLGSRGNFPDAIGVDHPPLAWRSGMGWKAVPFRKMKELGLLEGWEPPTRQPVSSPNESLESRPEVSTPALREALAERLQGLAEWKGDTLIFTDPNGTRPYVAEQLAELWRRPMPEPFRDLPGQGQMQREAVRLWAEDHTQYVSNPEDPAGVRHGRLNRWDDVTRAFRRIPPMEEGATVYRGMSWNQRSGDRPWKGFRAFLDELEQRGTYLPDPRKPADSWSLAASGARKYASAKRFQVTLVCENPRTARDISPLVRSLRGDIPSPSPAHPIPTDGEAVFLGGARFRVLKVEVQQDTPEGGRATVYVEEIR